MSAVDLVFVVLIVLSGIIGLFRGFFRELISLVTWVVGIWVAVRFSNAAAAYVPDLVTEPALRVGIAFAVLFILVLIAGGIVGLIVGRAVRRVGLGGSDRTFGFVFGVARGVLLVLVLVLVARLVDFDQNPTWQESATVPTFERWLDRALQEVPPAWRERLEQSVPEVRIPDPAERERAADRSSESGF